MAAASSREEEIYNVGDRVVLVGLKKASHLNGRHGHIGTRPTTDPTRYSVNLDLLDPSTPIPSVKAQNIKRESTTLAAVEEPRAGASRGCIEEKYGRPLNLIWDTIRFIAATEFMVASDVQTMEDIERMRFAEDSRQNARLNQFLAMAWSHWTDPGAFHTPDNMSMSEMARNWAQEQMKNQPEPLPPEGRQLIDIISNSFDHQTAAKSWNVRVHGEFWVVGSDDEGTFLIPKLNGDIVYQCVGLSSNLHDLIRGAYGQDPVLCTLTLIPFYGRLVYDGTVTPVQVVPGVFVSATGRQASALKAKVEEAKEQGRVVQRLRQLEVEGGSLEGLPTQGNIKIDRSSAPQEQPPPTTKEAKLVKKFKEITYAFDRNDEAGLWVFRRYGYTEQENPEHVGLILCRGSVLDTFHCAEGLAPTSTDILKYAVKVATRLNKRPGVLMPDDHACYQRVKFLLQDIPDTKVDYYHPPTPEETAAAMAGPPPY